MRSAWSCAESVAKTFTDRQAVTVDGALHAIRWDRPDEFLAAVVGFMHEK